MVHDVRRHVAAEWPRTRTASAPTEGREQGAGGREQGAQQGAGSRGSRRSLEEYLLCHVAVLIILGQSPDQLQQLLPLLGRSASPARLQGELSLVPV